MVKKASPSCTGVTLHPVHQVSVTQSGGFKQRDIPTSISSSYMVRCTKDQSRENNREVLPHEWYTPTFCPYIGSFKHPIRPFKGGYQADYKSYGLLRIYGEPFRYHFNVAQSGFYRPDTIKQTAECSGWLASVYGTAFTIH